MAGYLGSVPVPQATQHRESFTCTEGQTSFATAGYTAQFVDVYLNGSHLSPADFTATNGSDVVLAVAASADDVCDIISYTPFEIADQTFTGTTTIGGTTPTLTIGDAGAEDAKIVFDGNAVDYHIGLDDSADSLVIGKGSALGTTSFLNINSDGNIGANVIPEGSNGTWRNFQLGGANIAHRANGAADVFVGTNYLFETDNGEVLRAAEAGSRMFFNNNIITFQTLATGDAGSDLSATETLRIDARGTVGIGTDSPRSNDAITTLEISGNTYSRLVLQATGSGGREYSMLSGTAGEFWVYDYTAGAIRFKIDANGAVTMPAQPAFLAQPSSTQSNLAINTDHDIAFASERFDQGSNFANPNFTAPVDGKYQFNIHVYFNQLDVDGTFYEIKLITTLRTYSYIIDVRPFDADTPNWSFNASVLANMDATDTAKVVVKPYNSGAAQADIDSQSYFSGYLVA